MELAVINGHSAQDVSKSDWEQAKRELAGEPEIGPKEAILESAPESDRWNPVPGPRVKRWPWLQALTRTTRGEAIIKNWSKKASKAQTTIRCVRPV